MKQRQVAPAGRSRADVPSEMAAECCGGLIGCDRYGEGSEMHELGLTRNIVAICSEHAEGKRVTRVRLEIGSLSAVMPDAIRFCFDVVAEGTPCEGALLEIVDVADGDDLNIKEMETE
jgi:hypothetical protein